MKPAGSQLLLPLDEIDVHRLARGEGVHGAIQRFGPPSRHPLEPTLGLPANIADHDTLASELFIPDRRQVG